MNMVVMARKTILFLCAAFYVSFIYGIDHTVAQTADTSRVKIIGHRGFSAFAPENSLSAFRKSMALGADIIELDVHLSKDDSLMVIHDKTVDRTSNGKGAVADLTYQQLKKLDAGTWFCENYNDEKIPTLPEVFDLVNGQRTLLVELKWPQKGIYKTLVKQVVDLIRKYKAENWVIVQSFETSYLEELAHLAPDIKTQQLIVGKVSWLPVYMDRHLHIGKFTPVQNVNAVNCHYKYARRSFIRKMHKKNLDVYVYTVNKPRQILRAVKNGVDGIITNNSGMATKVMEENR